MSSPTSIADRLPSSVRTEIEAHLRQAPQREAAISDVLRLLQQALGYIDDDTLLYAAQQTGMPPVKVEELCSFYPLVLRRPAGRHLLRICDSVSCHLAGADSLLRQAEEISGVTLGQVAKEGSYSILPHVCLGLCDRAPAALVDGHAVGGFDGDALVALLASWEHR
ncbi:MAG: NAD(P)H-dependent oxidoreductase subunit E [Acidithiobacillus sp.]|uniref:NADH-quinone oxidoreductase subunit NuoE family protein n=1 Tax=Acidithiobacillus sp. TaxID=1872118 RepID=UPI0025C50AF6|nr:NAD(P)H-dependent oxidoreductase subunit E [Acidithiobacillus sp.]